MFLSARVPDFKNLLGSMLIGIKNLLSSIGIKIILRLRIINIKLLQDYIILLILIDIT